MIQTNVEMAKYIHTHTNVEMAECKVHLLLQCRKIKDYFIW